MARKFAGFSAWKLVKCVSIFVSGGWSVSWKRSGLFVVSGSNVSKPVRKSDDVIFVPAFVAADMGDPVLLVFL